MRAWLESIAGPEYASALMWTVFALIGLLVLLILIRIVRGLTFGTFVAGGRNRKARLAVMDATAVDSHRRLVLVRRDDVEHLILIGGPTDVVVEQNIRLAAAARRPAGEEHAEHPAPPAAQERPAPPPAPTTAAPRPPVQPPVPPRAAPPQPAAPMPPRPVPEGRFTAAPAATPPQPAARPVPAPAPMVHPPQPPAGAAKPAAAPQPNLDDALLQELQVSLDRDHRRPYQPPAARPTERSLDEEMSKLLGDLSAKR